ncbi:MAG: hypothetical protein H8F28_19765 [Fibrella sp.]|nr:hypothetical protein [Armatimonadota bacterium]
MRTAASITMPLFSCCAAEFLFGGFYVTASGASKNNEVNHGTTSRLAALKSSNVLAYDRWQRKTSGGNDETFTDRRSIICHDAPSFLCQKDCTEYGSSKV